MHRQQNTMQFTLDSMDGTPLDAPYEQHGSPGPAFPSSPASMRQLQRKRGYTLPSQQPDSSPTKSPKRTMNAFMLWSQEQRKEVCATVAISVPNHRHIRLPHSVSQTA